MAAFILRGWFDDSERDDCQHNVFSVAGSVGTADQWDAMDALWRADVLDAFEIPYLHMKELRSGVGSFKKFLDPEISRQLSEAIIGAFATSGVRPVSSMVRLSDLRRFNKDRQRSLNAYALNIYKCMGLVRLAFREVLSTEGNAALYFDKKNNSTGPAIEMAERYAKNDPLNPGLSECVSLFAMPKGKAGITPALQAADFIAWETRKHVETQRDFWDQLPNGLSNQALRNAASAWSKETGQNSPFERGSFRSFMLRTNTLLTTWTYDYLCQFDDFRNGIWGEVGRKVNASSSAESS